MYHYPDDIYTEPEPDTNTLANLGPLTGIAGIWTSADGMDVNPKARWSGASAIHRAVRAPADRCSDPDIADPVDSARTDGDGGRQGESRRKILHAHGHTRLAYQRHHIQSVSRAGVPHG